MTARAKFWGLLAAIVTIELLVLAAGARWLHLQLPAAASSGAILLVLAGVGVITISLLVGIWLWMERSLWQPLRSVTKGVQIISQTNPAHSLEIASSHLLDELPDAIHSLAEGFHDAKNEVAQALLTGAKEAEKQKTRLETVLYELNEGVLVCDAQSRILLYNPAAQRLLQHDVSLGLGRPLSGVIARAPIEHSLELLRRTSTEQDPSGSKVPQADFVCAAVNHASLLRCRLRLLSPKLGIESGFVLTFDDVTRQVEALSQRDDLLRQVLDEARQPLANIRAAAENLVTSPEMEETTRVRFERVLAEESARLSDRLNQLGDQARSLVGSEWLMADVYSTDLLDSVIRRMNRPGDPTVEMTGAPLWLHGDGHALMLLLEQLIRRIQRHVECSRFDIDVLMGNRRIYLDIVWQGEPIGESVLTSWLSEPLKHAVGALTIGDVIDLHGGQIWSQRHRRPESALLRFPVPTSAKQWEITREDLPARPEFYDFGLATPVSELGELADCPLESLDYVVFDTETTGLRPSLGDEVVSIAAVRIVNGRILPGETFERLVNPRRMIPKRSTHFHGITDDMVADKPPVEVVLPQFKKFVGDAVMVAHNGAFDMKFIQLKEKDAGCDFDNPLLDTLFLSVFLHSHVEDHSLDGIAARFSVDIVGRHTALGDTMVTAEIFVQMLELLKERGIKTLRDALSIEVEMESLRKKQASF